MIRRPKLHVLSPEGEKVFSTLCVETAVPREGELLIVPNRDEELRVTTVEHVYSEDASEEENSFTQDIYVETEDPGEGV